MILKPFVKPVFAKLIEHDESFASDIINKIVSINYSNYGNLSLVYLRNTAENQLDQEHIVKSEFDINLIYKLLMQLSAIKNNKSFFNNNYVWYINNIQNNINHYLKALSFIDKNMFLKLKTINESINENNYDNFKMLPIENNQFYSHKNTVISKYNPINNVILNTQLSNGINKYNKVFASHYKRIYGNAFNKFFYNNSLYNNSVTLNDSQQKLIIQNWNLKRDASENNVWSTNKARIINRNILFNNINKILNINNALAMNTNSSINDISNILSINKLEILKRNSVINTYKISNIDEVKILNGNSVLNTDKILNIDESEKLNRNYDINSYSILNNRKTNNQLYFNKLLYLELFNQANAYTQSSINQLSSSVNLASDIVMKNLIVKKFRFNNSKNLFNKDIEADNNAINNYIFDLYKKTRNTLFSRHSFIKNALLNIQLSNKINKYHEVFIGDYISIRSLTYKNFMFQVKNNSKISRNLFDYYQDNLWNTNKELRINKDSSFNNINKILNINNALAMNTNSSVNDINNILSINNSQIFKKNSAINTKEISNIYKVQVLNRKSVIYYNDKISNINEVKLLNERSIFNVGKIFNVNESEILNRNYAINTYSILNNRKTNNQVYFNKLLYSELFNQANAYTQSSINQSSSSVNWVSDIVLRNLNLKTFQFNNSKNLFKKNIEDDSTNNTINNYIFDLYRNTRDTLFARYSFIKNTFLNTQLSKEINNYNKVFNGNYKNFMFQGQSNSNSNRSLFDYYQNNLWNTNKGLRINRNSSFNDINKTLNINKVQILKKKSVIYYNEKISNINDVQILNEIPMFSTGKILNVNEAEVLNKNYVINMDSTLNNSKNNNQVPFNKLLYLELFNQVNSDNHISINQPPSSSTLARNIVMKKLIVKKFQFNNSKNLFKQNIEDDSNNNSKSTSSLNYKNIVFPVKSTMKISSLVNYTEDNVWNTNKGKIINRNSLFNNINKILDINKGLIINKKSSFNDINKIFSINKAPISKKNSMVYSGKISNINEDKILNAIPMFSTGKRLTVNEAEVLNKNYVINMDSILNNSKNNNQVYFNKLLYLELFNQVNSDNHISINKLPSSINLASNIVLKNLIVKKFQFNNSKKLFKKNIKDDSTNNSKSTSSLNYKNIVDSSNSINNYIFDLYANTRNIVLSRYTPVKNAFLSTQLSNELNKYNEIFVDNYKGLDGNTFIKSLDNKYLDNNSLTFTFNELQEKLITQRWNLKKYVNQAEISNGSSIFNIHNFNIHNNVWNKKKNYIRDYTINNSRMANDIRTKNHLTENMKLYNHRLDVDDFENNFDFDSIMHNRKKAYTSNSEIYNEAYKKKVNIRHKRLQTAVSNEVLVTEDIKSENNAKYVTQEKMKRFINDTVETLIEDKLKNQNILKQDEEKQIESISNKVLEKIERQLKYEKRRRGL